MNPFQELQTGDSVQRQICRELTESGILKQAARFSPVICGTFPLGIYTPGSDVDLLMEADDLDEWEGVMTRIGAADFKTRSWQDVPVRKTTLLFRRLRIECIAQPLPVRRQRAYQHMQIEYRLLQEDTELRSAVMKLRRRGWKTETAFCRLLSLDETDPYESLLHYGRKKQFLF
ncbi:DUF4269 domain-containing protein [Alkalicoccus urumqiensis]|uniref:DUF4269 domain-containing protein n=1 Tax=Alkalicoccus urumqiensis TaxID=1548213 RepID=A0A2P6MLE7_ALKUR|nr:DUF4269 domain-containing protein [Alkalicoccus urumqiensis]PRO67101.1 hypothetical protein C6I21_00600 [Alkalicoccus urumqiensis]